MGTLIETSDRTQIEALAADGSTAAIRRRAQLLLLYDEGLPTREVAEQIDLSLSRTRFWRRRYIFEGMQIFAESSLKTTAIAPFDFNCPHDAFYSALGCWKSNSVTPI